jgi:putative membrane protein
MSQATLIFFLILALTVALFAIQNAGPVTVRFGVWSVETSLVVVILVAAAAGAALASLLGLPGWIRDRRRLRAQEREIEAMRATRPPAPATSSESPPHPPA